MQIVPLPVAPGEVELYRIDPSGVALYIDGKKMAILPIIYDDHADTD